MTRKPRVYEQGGSTFVIGTDNISEARTVIGIAPDTHQWAGTSYGLYVRRQGLWRNTSSYAPPKDARPGVVFHGPIRRQEAS